MILLSSDASQTVSMFIPLIVAVLIPVSMSGMNALNKIVTERENKKESCTTLKVRHNNLLLGILVFLDVLCVVAAFLFPVLYLCDIPDGPPWDVTLAVACCFGVLAVGCSLFTFVIKRWQIEADEEQIIVIPFLGKSRAYDWDEFECVIAYLRLYGDVNIYKAYVKGCKKPVCSFSSHTVNGERLANEFKKRVRIDCRT